MRIRNSGFVDAGSAILKIARNGNSPVIPTDSSVYIGEFPTNDTVETRFKVSVSREAGEQSYPLDVFVIYEDESGDTRTSDILTIGVPVKGKIEFVVTRNPGTLRAGEKSVIEVEYQNIGAATAYCAQASMTSGGVAPREVVVRYSIACGTLLKTMIQLELNRVLHVWFILVGVSAGCFSMISTLAPAS